ncbi:zinc finger protein 782-like [Oncorhynchus nerka]|uniref:zinc finger protein 782-like n=1 Tax=Oncorhynchus nerka TaxID=8023 RepID=UPI0011322079|nr:zinc finger protein 782-like isoform X1 [Oncorhynchus nerka]
MASCNFQSQLVSIMEILAKAAVAEINKRVDDSCAVIRLEVTQSQRDIDGLKRKCQMMEGELKKTRGRVRRKAERSLYPVKIVLNKQRICSQWRDGEMAVEEDSQPQPTDVEQRAETEPILIKDEETAEDVWKTDPQEELRITGEESGSKPGQPPSFEQRHFDEDFITQPNISPEDSVEHYPNSDGPKEPCTPRCTSVEKSKVFSTEQHRPAEDEDSQELVMVKDEKEEDLDQTTVLAGPDQFVMDETDGQRWTSVDPGRETDPEGHPDFSFHSTEEYSQNISIFPPHSGLPSLPTMTDGVGPSVHSSRGKPHANMFSTAAHMKRHVRTLADETRQQMPEEQSSETLNSNNDGNSLALQPRQHQHRASEATVRMSECMTGSNMATTSTFSGYSLSRSSFNMVKRMRTQWRSGGTTERRFSCTFCGKSFQRFSQLKEHLRSHTGEKPYTCEQCGRSFTKQCNLIRHAVVHSGEKPYECSQCGKCFTQRSSMKSHQRTHIGESPVSQHVVPAYPGDPHTSLMLSQTRWNK